MSSKFNRIVSCKDKVRHDTRRNADVALAATRTLVNYEQMEPYYCKFCHGWHNGHVKNNMFMEYEVTCGCQHKAMSHQVSPNSAGCYECDCLWSREAVYRNEVGLLLIQMDKCKKKTDNIMRKCGKVMALIPSALLFYMRDKLKEYNLRIKE